ncbi:olfactory receptor 9A4-like [Antechinus flavipes]|uniref:olfactory receptor 9A4-like n=1 Tax=Antechinus flavipes TaxID=38775 RepID=UPI002235E0A7|nr:olfactory receptor 9A4-like [Antechinus flavipes]
MFGNHSGILELKLLGFSGSQDFHHMLFSIFFLLYMVTFIGNSLIIVMVCMDYRLHSPMYFFLGNISAMEILTTTIVIPTMLGGLLTTQIQTMSFGACMAQLFLLLSVGTSEFVLLAAMAVDRYVAICNPLRYSLIMNHQVCLWVVIVSWVFGFLFQIWPITATYHLYFCGPNVLNHFFCERGQLLKLTCGDSRFQQFILFLMAAFILFGSLLPTIVSYIYIICTILRIPSASGRKKAFSTCASHFTMVVIGYGTCLFLYVKPKQSDATEYNKMISLMTSVVTPLLNPFIFTLRNDQFIEVLKDAIKRLGLLLKK